MISFSGVTIGSKREEKCSKQKLEVNAMSSISHNKQLTKKKISEKIHNCYWRESDAVKALK